MEGGAVKGPNGEPVFLYADGRVEGADGKALPSEIAADIQWSGIGPSTKDYFAAK